MANADHVELSRKGREAIAEWRHSNPDKTLQLAGADLVGADLIGANLIMANLCGANFSKAKLITANLTCANLTCANFTFANLSGANLSKADLNEADLRDSNLTDANLCGANLTRADLARAILGLSALSDVDLSTVTGLELVKHLGPSSIGIDTLFRSQGKIPESFLRECGIPDVLITYLPSLVGAGIDFYSSFISYSHKNEEFAQRLHSRMQQEHLRVWYAPEDIAGGKKLHEQIFDAIRVHDKLLFVLSEHSMNSEWGSTEIRRARKREREEHRQVLFPIRLVKWDKIAAWECFDADSGKDLAVEIREYYIPDFSNWKDHDKFEAEFAKLIRDLKHPREPVPTAPA